jgi:ABC-type amino acid transport substrate-binding protein
MKSLLILLTSFFFCNLSLAEDIPDVKFCVANSEPWSYKGDNGEPQGIVIDYAQRLSDITSIAHTYILQSYPRVFHSLMSGDCD